MTYSLYLGDCLDIVPTLPAGSVDAIITDIPYGTTQCSWDSVIPLEPMWAIVKHVLKPSGVFVTTASQPFTSAPVMSNLEWFRYEWIVRKNRMTGFLDVGKKPLKNHENVLVFSANGHTYNPQMTKGERHGRGKDGKYADISQAEQYGDMSNRHQTYSNEFYPCSVINISSDKESFVTFAQRPCREERHPTQKPVALYEYLIRTYTNPGETVLDIAMGSGTTIVAAIQTDRNGIGVEKEEKYFKIAERRANKATLQPGLFQLDDKPQPKQSNLFQDQEKLG